MNNNLAKAWENVAVREVITEEVNVLNVQTQSLESQFNGDGKISCKPG